eukprot:TRINITY_DN1472_c0_g3_i1.p1 TRINITY_DN1472_c0_g3~~TRINITY_DN1472_c0_g3_i1.p1  ORF type:complete len:112 (+),score=24.07 TRINITY_DN1472_c0_g3_i1:49-384(+)
MTAPATRASTWTAIFRVLNEKGPLTRNRLWQSIRDAQPAAATKGAEGDEPIIRSKNHLKQILVDLADRKKIATRCVTLPDEVTVHRGHLKGKSFVYEALPKKSAAAPAEAN